MDKISITKEEANLLKCKLKGIEPLLVVAGLIEKDNKYLIANRNNGDLTVVTKWEFPGGKVKENESEKDAIEREIKEEFDLSVKADKYINNVIYAYPERIINLKLWHCIVVDEHIKMDESDHNAYKWVTLDEINIDDLCPADRELYLKIKS